MTCFRPRAARCLSRSRSASLTRLFMLPPRVLRSRSITAATSLSRVRVVRMHQSIYVDVLMSVWRGPCDPLRRKSSSVYKRDRRAQQSQEQQQKEECSYARTIDEAFGQPD